MVPVIIIVVIVLLILFWGVSANNGLVTAKNRADEGWSSIDVELKRRHDLIPNLVETVKGYAAHESSVFENVTKARTAAVSASTPAAQAQAENMLTGTLRQLFALQEAYPDLKANQNFLALQSELTQTEDRIEGARRIYNGDVRDYNTRLQRFPTSIVAGMRHFAPRDFFELDDPADREPVKVSFS